VDSLSRTHGTRTWDTYLQMQMMIISRDLYQLTSPPTINIMDENPVADRAVGFLVQCIYMHVTERSTVSGAEYPLSCPLKLGCMRVHSHDSHAL